MQRSRNYQPMTKNTSDLVIGLMKASIGKAGDYTTAAQHKAAYPNGADALTTFGALKNGSLSMKPTFKEHKSGYPQAVDFKIAELLAASFKFDPEEIGSPMVLGLIDAALNCLDTGTLYNYAVEGLAEFAAGGTMSMFAPYAQLKPTLNLNFGDDFAVSPFEFECLTNPNYNAKELVYRMRQAAAARDIANQPITQSPANLAIGKFQVRVGKPQRRAVVGVPTQADTITNIQLRKSGGAKTMASGAVIAAGSVYTGAIDGAFILECTDNTASNVHFTVTKPDSTAGIPVTFVDGTAELVGDGVSVQFDAAAVAAGAAAFAVGDIYVIGVYTSQAVDNANTGILSPYSFLTAADSVGAINTASLATNPTFKEHFSGYPQVKDMVIVESSTMEVSTALEEVNAAVNTAITRGYATTMFDILFDAAVSGSLYYVPVEIVANLATGLTFSLWFPNAQIVPEFDFAPGNDWANIAFKLDAQFQGLTGMRRAYRMTEVPDSAN